MLPVACLPVCGILMGIGYILAPAAMAGEVQGFTAGGLAYSIGLFLIKAGGALIDNMSWLFAVGVAVGMADDSDGTAGLAGLVSMYMITTLLSPGAVAGITGRFFRNYPFLCFPIYLSFASNKRFLQRPYIVRFIIFNRLFVPSTKPLL